MTKKHHRTCCVVTGESPIHSIHTFKNFPISMSCIDNLDTTADVFEDMNWGYSSAGHIQLTDVLDPDLIYKDYHSPGTVGKMWKEHHSMLADFIKDDTFVNVLEIGGAAGSLLGNFVDDNEDFTWTIIEPSCNTNINDPRVRSINGYFEDYKFDTQYDTVVHSHVFEHVYNPVTFLEKINSILDYGNFHYISIPNMKYWLENGFTNTLSFEHTFYVDEKVLTYLLANAGFKVVEQRSSDHSVVVKAVKSRDVHVPTTDFLYVKELFETYIAKLTADVAAVNAMIGDSKFYLFGGHIFAQALLNMGLKSENIECILDNDPKKHNKRLYGTNCIVQSPQCLKDVENPIVLLRGGSYTDEIKDSILKVNSTTQFI